MNNFDRHSEIKIINTIAIILQSHKYIKEQSNIFQ